MRFIKKLTGFTAILLAVCVVMSLTVTESASAGMPSRRMIRAGLNWGTTAVPSADLANNPGNGFEWGTFNTINDNFTLLGSTDASRVVVAVGGEANQLVIRRVDNNAVLHTFAQNGTAELFGVRPIGENPSTRYRSNTRFNGADYTFFGSFRFERRGNLLTVVNIVDIEHYVKGVVPYEMSPNWHIEALRAQAIAARSFAMFRMANTPQKSRDNRFDLCIEACCQVYWGRRRANERTNQSVTSTRGMVVTHGGRLAETLYSSSHGGGSENNENVWPGGVARPYLRGVNDTFELDVAHQITHYNWTHNVPQATLTARVRTARPNEAFDNVTWIRVAERTPTGNVRSVQVYVDGGGSGPRALTQLFTGRAALQSLFGVQTTANTVNGMRSQRFDIETSGVAEGDWLAIPVGTNVTIRGTGWGHNVGLSQWGAQSMASIHGRTAAQIIAHYFTGVEIVEMEMPPIGEQAQAGSWRQTNNGWRYEFNAGGFAQGWQRIGGESYFFNSAGIMQTGWLSHENQWYFMHQNGAMATGWVHTDGHWYYLQPSGVMATGWILEGGSWYLLHQSGAMATGWVRWGNVWYFLNSNGSMATGWVRSGGNWYFLEENGVMATGWVETGGQWYYMRANGAMVGGRTHTIDGVRHRFAADGRWLGRA
ncbi:MAG: SpoIID/LytB domain-containing protein [Oscillospiraceae bacterium]|nr:SpoIID/LytB domain-containing protein [Oscillospiraceae bacterium]MCL2278487.1 SpoIID/LytB domain-containing protein [Oscillospiraceae bacterium]